MDIMDKLKEINDRLERIEQQLHDNAFIEYQTSPRQQCTCGWDTTSVCPVHFHPKYFTICDSGVGPI